MVILIYSIKLMSTRMAGNEDIKVKTTWLLPKSLVKQLKQYALDNDSTLTATVIEACNDFLAKKKKR
jgi:hypothetical protein